MAEEAEKGTIFQLAERQRLPQPFLSFSLLFFFRPLPFTPITLCPTCCLSDRVKEFLSLTSVNKGHEISALHSTASCPTECHSFVLLSPDLPEKESTDEYPTAPSSPCICVLFSFPIVSQSHFLHPTCLHCSAQTVNAKHQDLGRFQWGTNCSIVLKTFWWISCGF